MNQKSKFITLSIIGILAWIASRASKKSFSMTFRKFSNPVALKLASIYGALQSLGYSDEKIRWMLAQILHETGQFTSRSQVAVLNNNYSGIKWINKPYQKASKGSPVPPSERSSRDVPTNYYAKFDSLADWAADYVRILNIRSKPIQAGSLDQFLERLADNGYYDARTAAARNNYTRSVKKFHSLLV